MTCGYLIPSWDEHFRGMDRDGCLLLNGHKGYHLSKLKSGKYISWGGYACDEDCGPSCAEGDSCFNNDEIEESVALAIISGEQENYDD